LKGQHAVQKTFFLRGKRCVINIPSLNREVTMIMDRYSVLPAISLDGIISVKVVEGSFNTDLFLEFIEGLLDRMNPFPAKNSVRIMDNCRIHKDPIIVNRILEQ